MSEEVDESEQVWGFIAGVWDLLHPGHLDALHYAKNNCDKLFVGLQSDPTHDRPHKNKPIQTLFERYAQLKSCKYVDKIVPYDTEQDLENYLACSEHSILFVGTDHKNDVITGLEINNLKEQEGQPSFRLEFIPRHHNYSTSELRDRIVKQSRIIRVK